MFWLTYIWNIWKNSYSYTNKNCANNKPNVVLFRSELTHYYETLKDIKNKKAMNDVCSAHYGKHKLSNLTTWALSQMEYFMCTSVRL